MRMYKRYVETQTTLEAFHRHGCDPFTEAFYQRRMDDLWRSMTGAEKKLAKRWAQGEAVRSRARDAWLSWDAADIADEVAPLARH